MTEENERTPASPLAPSKYQFPRLIGKTALSIIVILGSAAATCMFSIHWNGRQVPYSFTKTPTSFFIASLALAASGAALGMSNIAVRAPDRRLRLWLVKISGGVLLGLQSYGIWVLLPFQSAADGVSSRIIIVLTALHMMGVFFLLLLISAMEAVIDSRGPSHMPVPSERFGFKVASVYWFLLGLGWAGLLAGAALAL